MSLTDRIGSLLQRPNDDLVSKDDVPAWMKLCARGLGVIAGGLGLFFGVFNLVFNLFSIYGLLSSALTCSVAFSVLVFEAPFCCMFLPVLQDASNIMESRPYWNKAAYYMMFAVLISTYLSVVASAFPNLFYFSFSQFFGLMLIFCTGLLYGSMALGKKGSSSDMAAVAGDTAAMDNSDLRDPA